MEIADGLQRTRGFRLPITSPQGQKATGPCRCPQTEDPAGLAEVGISGVGWYSFRHTVGTILAEMGEHQLTIMQVALPQVVAACRAACGQSAKSTLIQ